MPQASLWTTAAERRLRGDRPLTAFTCQLSPMRGINAVDGGFPKPTPSRRVPDGWSRLRHRGACILMRGILAAHGMTDRKVFVADSFQGLPKPDPAYPVDNGAEWHLHPKLAVSRAQVEANFARYGLLDAQVVFLEGWFMRRCPARRWRRW